MKMDRLNSRLAICATFLWICVGRKQVNCYYNDGLSLLNPVRSDLDVWHQRSSRVSIKTNGNLTCERPPIYICEETLDPVPADVRKSCNYRNQRYHEQIFRWVAGRGCLLYTPDFLYVGAVNTINLNAGCFYGSWFAPCLEIPKEDGTCGCYPFDPGLEEVAQAVRKALIPSAHGRWESCFYAAADCCSHYMVDDTNFTVPNHCEATFDGWTCWKAAKANTISTEVCSEFSYSGQGPSCHHYSTKQCYPNASWEIQTDYSTCSITPRLLRRYRFYIAVLSISIISCLPAIFVFTFYKRLRNNTRVALHRNLLIVIILKNILVIVSRSAIYIDELTNPGDTVMSNHGIVCRLHAFTERAATNAVFVFMLVEAIYLHRLIVAVFRRKLNINVLYGIGAVITVLPAIAWAVVMSFYDDHSCWLVYTVENIQWILDAPRVAILLINTVLFADVLRVLLTQVRNTENVNQLSTAKASLFLMPIFGLQFILTAFRPSTNNCTWEQTYYYISYTVESLQGFIVAMLYCYVNKEVHTLVKATYRRAENAVISRVRRDTTIQRPSSVMNSERKLTNSTSLTLTETYKEPVIKPRLHVAEIISIQASERLADILEPVYETIDFGVTNEGYDALERSDADNDSGFIPNRVQDEYYGFTNASSISIDCQEWIQRPTSSNSVCGNSLNDFPVKKDQNNIEKKGMRKKQSKGNKPLGVQKTDPPLYKNVDTSDNNATYASLGGTHNSSASMFDDLCREDMLGEIMQYMENSEISKAIMLDPSLLMPNRADGDGVVFVHEDNDDAYGERL